ncbi:MAG: hypothetical protein KDA22_14460 [Phycisphaerales bacterium]|nr:hypothetical protein [Phycisphaerales bacterium]
MSIFPLPVFEADADPTRREALTDEEIYAQLRPPSTIVVRFGSMRLVGEFPYEGDAKPGCGSKLVARTVRGTEVAEMLTTTCSNSGCSKSVTRKEMLAFIDNSGGKDYPFHEHGRILRVATVEDLNEWSQIQGRKPELLRQARAIVAAANLSIKVVEVEPIFGGETTTVFYLSEERIDFRDAVRTLASEFKSRIEMRQVGARDEARLVADYERCGQHCCCKNFLKVLKPVSMKSAKVQKATLDPLKISGRCGRLMCCLRYEDQTYEELKSRLPRMKSRVGTPEGPGLVVDTKILVQLVLVRLEHDGREVAVPVEELCAPEAAPQPGQAPSDPLRGMSAQEAARRSDPRRRGGRPERAPRGDRSGGPGGDRGRDRRRDERTKAPHAEGSPPEIESGQPPADGPPAEATAARESAPSPGDATPREGRRKRRRGRKKRSDRPEGRTREEQQDAFRAKAQRLDADERGESAPGASPPAGGDGTSGSGSRAEERGDGSERKPPRRKRRRRGRRRGKGEGGGSDHGGGDGGGPTSGA